MHWGEGQGTVGGIRRGSEHETCPLSTWGRMRRVHLVQGEGQGTVGSERAEGTLKPKPPPPSPSY